MKIDYSGIIRIMRGDSFEMPLPINMGTTMEPIYKQLEENEFLYFGVMEPNQAFENAVLKKKYDKDSEKDEDGNTLLILKPEDTLNLLVGTYYYSLKFVKKNNKGDVENVKTLISPTQFWLLGNNPTNKRINDSGYVPNYGNTDFLSKILNTSEGKNSIVGNDVENNKALGEYSSAFGKDTLADSLCQFIVGYRNASDSDSYFIVGNGEVDSSDEMTRSNAFAVKKDGSAEVQTQGETDNSVATKKYVDSIKTEIENIKTSIEASLDNIIAIQENLIGGDSV